MVALLNYYLKDFTNINRACLNAEELKELKNKNASEWNKKNKIRRNILRREKIICECGEETTKSYLWKHKKNETHRNYLKSLS